LGAIPFEERRVASSLLLAQDIDLSLELGVGRDRAGLADDLPALQDLLVDAAEQDADVVAGHPLLEGLLERLDAGDRRVQLGAEADDLDLVADLDLAALDPAGADGAPALDREDVLDGHQERLVDLADRLGDVLIHRLDQVEDRLADLGIPGVFQGRAAAAADDRDLLAGELVVG